MRARFATLLPGDPLSVYYEAGRGPQLAHAVGILFFEHPPGAGPGRWGLSRAYFRYPTPSHAAPCSHRSTMVMALR